MKPMPPYKFMISGGGTGGHIFPALAIADALKARYPDAEFLFVGAKDRMEMERIPAVGYNIKGIWISGIQRKLSLSNVAFPFKLISSIVKCRSYIRKFKPNVVIGTGGFASGPLLYTAAQKNIPTLIQEQNSYAGITNKLLASKAQTICVAYAKMEKFFPKEKIVFTGNPIRENIKKGISPKDDALQKIGLDPKRPTLLILGGSLGARKVNHIISNQLENILNLGINVLWQTGKLYIDTIKEKHQPQEGNRLKIQAFISEMNDAYGAADIIISRAGAGTISELAVAKKATILIPSPNVAEDHQTKNALALVENKAAYLFKEKDNEDQLLKHIKTLLDTEERKILEDNIEKMAKPNAAEEIANEVEKLLVHAK